VKLVYNDEQHAYWLDGRRVKSASKVANICADMFTVEQWGKRMVAIGMTLDPSLAERVAVDLDNKETINKVCDKAKDLAKANAKAERGTQRHRVLELLLLGQDDMFITPQQKADAVVLQRTLDRYHLEPIPDRVEQFIAYPDDGVVGRYDAILRHDGGTVLVDLKGGINAVRYPHSTLTQLALYRFAPYTSKAIIKNGDKSTVDEWTGWPDDLNDEVAYVIHCDDEAEVGDLYRLDLAHGKAGAELALQVVAWRKGHKYGEDAVTKIESGVATSVSVSGEAVAPPPTVLDLAQQRMAADKERKIESGEVASSQSQPPSDSPPDEGGEVLASDVATLAGRYNKLPEAAKAWTGTLIAQGKHGHDWHIRNHPTIRRYEIYRGVLTLAEWGNGAPLLDDIIRAALHDHTDTPPGVIIGQLDAEQAAQFAHTATHITQDRTTLEYGADGTPLLKPVA
jgi:hypothetical protein